MNWGHWGNIRDVGGTLRGQWGTLGGTEDNGECWGAQGTVGNTGGTLGPMGEMGAMGALGGVPSSPARISGGEGGAETTPPPHLRAFGQRSEHPLWRPPRGHGRGLPGGDGFPPGGLRHPPVPPLPQRGAAGRYVG